MGYEHIENLYRPEARKILLFKEVYAMEKIHGTSARVRWKDGQITFSSGGEKHERFVAFFNEEELKAKFMELGHEGVIVYGEAYGGKCQKMSETYGKELRFVAFEVQIGDTWLNVENAAEVVQKLGLEFVHYVKIPTTIEAIDEQRDAPSVQAKRNGIVEDKIREGVVLRPLEEFVGSYGERVIVKHKRPEFAERVTQPEIDEEKLKIMEDANAIAFEWVTDMRLDHVLDKMGNPEDVRMTGKVVKAMIEDVCREAEGEIVDTRAVRKAIGMAASKKYTDRLKRISFLSIKEMTGGNEDE